MKVKVNRSFTIDDELLSVLKEKPEKPGRSYGMNASEAVNEALRVCFQDPSKLGYDLKGYVEFLEERLKALRKASKAYEKKRKDNQGY